MMSCQSRESTGDITNRNLQGSGAPVWMKLERTGNTITGYRSNNNISWKEVNSVTIDMASEIYVGLGVSPNDETKVCKASFANVTITP